MFMRKWRVRCFDMKFRNHFEQSYVCKAIVLFVIFEWSNFFILKREEIVNTKFFLKNWICLVFWIYEKKILHNV